MVHEAWPGVRGAFAAWRKITTARADEVPHADPQILEEQLAIEATVQTSHADNVMQMTALNHRAWRIFWATIAAYDDNYKVFSIRARVYLKSGAGV